MSKTIKEIKDFTRRKDGATRVVLEVSGREVEVDSMSMVSTEDGTETLILHGWLPFDEPTGE